MKERDLSAKAQGFLNPDAPLEQWVSVKDALTVYYQFLRDEADVAYKREETISDWQSGETSISSENT